jgi:hypothetical protein
MSGDHWFSATLRFFIVSSAEGKLRVEDSIFLARAVDFDSAFRKFVKIGQTNETAYQNVHDDQIKKRFAAITTLDLLPDDLKGAEVNSMPIFETDKDFGLDDPLNPESSEPTQTVGYVAIS